MQSSLFKSTLALTALTLGSVVLAQPGPEDRPTREEMIAQFDTDGDGKLSKAERAAAKEAMKEMRSRGPGGRLIEEFDADGDGQLNETERATAEAAIRARIESNPRAMERLDTDGDGVLSDEEFEAGRAKMEAARGNRGGPGRDRD